MTLNDNTTSSSRRTIFKIFSVHIPNPFFPLGLIGIFKNQPGRFASAVFQTGLLVFVLYAVFSTGVFLHGKTLIRAMNADGLNLSAVSRYLNLETAAFMIGIVASLSR